MAAPGYLLTLLNALPSDIKKVLVPAFDYVTGTWRLGDGTKATNALWYRVSATTSSNANTEFSVAHGLDSAPTKLIPIVDLTVVGAQLVPLSVSRAPDDKRVYLTSSSTGAAITFYLE